MPRRRREVERELTRKIVLTYLQSIQVSQGDRPAEDFFHVGTDFSPLDQLKPKGKRGKARVQDILETKFPYLADPQRRRVSDTGWIISDQYSEIDWSKVAYRIGIKEVGMNNFVYAPISSRVSIPIKSPKPIWKVLLKTREDIPPSFSATQAWIQYHVTFDDGQTWHRINPLDKPTRFNEDGTIVPRIITINAEVASNSPEETNLDLDAVVKSVRLRYTLYTDKEADSSDGSSPIIKSVQLLVYPRGGLSDSRPEQVI